MNISNMQLNILESNKDIFLDKESAVNLYREDQNKLFLEARRICEKIYGNKVFLRGLIEISNVCTRDCLYCGIRKSNLKVLRYKLTKEEIIETVRKGYRYDLKTFVLQSGEFSYTVKELCEIVESIKNITNSEAAITLSCGLMSKKQYKDLKDAGCNRYLMRFETSDEKLYSTFRKDSLQRRIKGLMDLKELGFEVGSGFMVGLPGETEEIRINNALLCNELALDMVGIGPFIPHQDTPLADAIQEPIELTIRLTALLRILLPYSNIPATTAAGTLSIDGRERMLWAGANVLMPNITPNIYKKNYLLYPNKICIDESGFECIGCLNNRVKSIGKELSFERGDSYSFGLRN